MKILIYGCTGSYNYGDELSHKTLKHLVKVKYPDAYIITVGCVLNILNREHYTSDKLITTSQESKLLEEVKTCDFWIYGAGTIMPFKMVLSEKLFNVNNKFEIWGVSCGTEVTDDKHIEMIKSCRYISVRDDISAKRLQLYHNNVVEVIQDPMLHHCIINNKKNGFNGITISNHVEAWRNGWATDDMRENLYSSLANAMNEIGGKWLAIPASWNKTAFDNDIVCHEKLKEYFPTLEIYEPTNFDDVTNVLTGLNCYFTSRLHTGVVSHGSNIPTVWFGMQKCLDLCETWGEKYKNLYADFYTKITKEKLLLSYKHACDLQKSIL